MELLARGLERPRVTPVAGRSPLIDGQALVSARRRPSECNTFDEIFRRKICESCSILWKRF